MAKAPQNIPFALVAGHLISIPVLLNGSKRSRFILDTGIGLDLISRNLSDSLGCNLTGKHYSGRRMSGQLIPINLAKLSSLALGGYEKKDDLIGVLDTSAFPSELASIEGFVSLKFFENVPFTLDYKSSILTLENETSLASRPREGATTKSKVKKDGTTVSVFLDLILPDGKPATFEVDTGSDVLILNSEFMKRLESMEGSKIQERSREKTRLATASQDILDALKGE